MRRDEIAAAFADFRTPLLRTDWSDEAGWARVVAALPTGLEDLGDLADDGLGVAQLVTDWDRGRGLGFLLVVDARSMRDDTVVWVDLSLTVEDIAAYGGRYGRTLRCAAADAKLVEATLAANNVDFGVLADLADDSDGVLPSR